MSAIISPTLSYYQRRRQAKLSKLEQDIFDFIAQQTFGYDKISDPLTFGRIAFETGIRKDVVKKVIKTLLSKTDIILQTRHDVYENLYTINHQYIRKFNVSYQPPIVQETPIYIKDVTYINNITTTDNNTPDELDISFQPSVEFLNGQTQPFVHTVPLSSITPPKPIPQDFVVDETTVFGGPNALDLLPNQSQPQMLEFDDYSDIKELPKFLKALPKTELEVEKAEKQQKIANIEAHIIQIREIISFYTLTNEQRGIIEYILNGNTKTIKSYTAYTNALCKKALNDDLPIPNGYCQSSYHPSFKLFKPKKPDKKSLQINQITLNNLLMFKSIHKQFGKDHQLTESSAEIIKEDHDIVYNGTTFIQNNIEFTINQHDTIIIIE